MALSKPLLEWEVPQFVEQEEEVSALLTGAPDSDRSQVLTVHIDMEEKNSLSGGPKSGLFKKSCLIQRIK